MEEFNKTIQLLVNGRDAAYVIDDWNARNYDFDIRVRRAKTKGKVVLEIKNPIYAQWVVNNYNAQVHIKD